MFITLGLYLVAKILEQLDHHLSAIMSTGGHPWKHVASACALSCYVIMVGRRHSLLGGAGSLAGEPGSRPALPPAKKSRPDCRLADLAVGPT